jgi:hypothetical protein
VISTGKKEKATFRKEEHYHEYLNTIRRPKIPYISSYTNASYISEILNIKSVCRVNIDNTTMSHRKDYLENANI